MILFFFFSYCLEIEDKPISLQKLGFTPSLPEFGQMDPGGTPTIKLNELKSLNFNKDLKVYSFQATSNQLYVVETIGNCDTIVKIKSKALGTITDDNSGIDKNGRIYFKTNLDEEILIYISLSDSNASGTVELQVRRQKFVMFGYEDIDGNSTNSDLDSPYNDFKSSFDCVTFKNATESNALNIDDRGLQNLNSEIVFLSGHGDKDNITKGSIFYFKTGTLSISKGFDMSRVNLVVWAACYSACKSNKHGISIAEKAILNGAKTSLGFEEDVSFSSSKTFTNCLFNQLSHGKTIDESAKIASSKLLWPWDSAKKYSIFGDKALCVTECRPTPSKNNRSRIPFTLEKYFPLGNFEKILLYDNIYRYYETKNGYLTNNFLDVAHYENEKIIIENHLKDYQKILDVYINEEQCIRSVLTKNNIASDFKIKDTHKIYYNYNSTLIPLQIIEIIRNDSNVSGKTEYYCINLNDGNFINYSDINIAE